MFTVNEPTAKFWSGNCGKFADNESFKIFLNGVSRYVCYQLGRRDDNDEATPEKGISVRFPEGFGNNQNSYHSYDINFMPSIEKC